MSLVLLRSGYPTVAVRPEDHQAYFATLQKVQASAGIEGLIACFTRGLMSRRTVGVWQPGLVTSRRLSTAFRLTHVKLTVLSGSSEALTGPVDERRAKDNRT